jgi:hypothetical protein
MAKGNMPRPIRFDNDTWFAAVAAFPAERGKTGGLSAEVQGFVAFLAENPEVWRSVKERASANGVAPWVLIAEAVAEYAA